MSAAAFHVLHVGYPTQKSWVPNLLFPVDVSRIARAKHGRCVCHLSRDSSRRRLRADSSLLCSDTGSYNQVRFLRFS